MKFLSHVSVIFSLPDSSGILRTTVVNLFVDKPFPFIPLTILSPTRTTFTDLVFTFPFPVNPFNAVFLFPIVMGTMAVLADCRSDFEGSLVKEFGGSNC